LAETNIHRREASIKLAEFAGFGRTSRDAGLSSNSGLTDMGQFPGDKTGQLRAELDKFKLIRRRAHSEAARYRAAFGVHH